MGGAQSSGAGTRRQSSGGRSVGAGSEPRGADTTPEREGRADQMSRTPAPGPARCGARSRLTLIGSVPEARAPGHPNGREVAQSGRSAPAAGRC